MRSLNVFFDVSISKFLNRQLSYRWFKTVRCSCDVTVMGTPNLYFIMAYFRPGLLSRWRLQLVAIIAHTRLANHLQLFGDFHAIMQGYKLYHDWFGQGLWEVEKDRIWALWVVCIIEWACALASIDNFREGWLWTGRMGRPSASQSWRWCVYVYAAFLCDCLHACLQSLKSESRHDANFVVTSGCRYDNHRWWQSWHHDDSRFHLYNQC